MKVRYVDIYQKQLLEKRISQAGNVVFAMKQ